MNTPKIQNQQPTVFHITHWKAGSQWIHKIFLELVPERVVTPLLDEKQFLEMPLVQGSVYPTVYVTKEQFHSVKLPANHRKFVIIRDLRDTLVSGYFSILYSHPVIDDRLAGWREHLNSMTIEAGLLMLIEEWLPPCAKIQASWLEANEYLIHYEDLLEHDLEILETVLIGHCGLSVERERFRQAVIDNRFEKITAGRARGNEDVQAHERKGVAGDWQNYFTRRVKEAFKNRYGELLVATGYARDLNW